MDIQLMEALCRESDTFKSELIVANSVNPKYAEAISRILNLIQMKSSLSKKFLKGYKNTIEYKAMLKKPIFEAFIEIELEIKEMYSKEAEKEKEIISMESLLDYFGSI